MAEERIKIFYPTFEARYMPPFKIGAPVEVPLMDSPKRFEKILPYIEEHTEKFEIIKIASIGVENLVSVHDRELVEFYSLLRNRLKKKDTVESWVYPFAHAHKPSNPLLRAGYFCFDTRTVIKREGLTAALNAATSAKKAAEELVANYPQVRHILVLTRPPGHHAGRRFYGGFSFINNAAISAAVFLTTGEKVAIIDLDYYHGNGTQDIFYETDQVLTLSIHRTPSKAFPFLWGYKEEKGRGRGKGWNFNLPIGGNIGPDKYIAILEKVIALIEKRKIGNVIISLGTNIHKSDLTGGFGLDTKDFEKVGAIISSINARLLTVIEGGFVSEVLKESILAYLEGIYAG